MYILNCKKKGNDLQYVINLKEILNMNEYQDKDYIDKEYDHKQYLQKNKNINIIFIGIVILELGLIVLMSDFIFVQAMELFSMVLVQIQCLLLFIGIFTGALFILCRGLLRLKYINILTEKDALTKSTDKSMDSYRQMKQERLVTMIIGAPLALIWALLVYIFFSFEIDLSFLPIDTIYILWSVMGLFFFSVYLLDGQFWKKYYKADLLFRIELFQLANVIVALYGIVISVFLGYVVLTSNTSATLIILCLVSACILGIPFYIKAIVLFKNNQNTTPQ